MSNNRETEPRLAANRTQSAAGPRRRVERPGLSALVAGWRYRSIWIATIAIFVVSAVFQPASLNATSLGAVAFTSAVLMTVSAGQTLVMQQRGIDLSVPGTITLSAVLPAVLIMNFSLPFVAALILTGIVAVVIGLINGFLVTKLGITPLITTLAVNSIVIGVLYTIGNGPPSVSAPPELELLVGARVGGIPIVFLTVVAGVVLIAIYMGTSTWGRRFVAVGMSPDAARTTGYIPERYIIAAFAISSLAACIGGLLLVGYLGSARITTGSTYLFTSIAAPVLGGIALTGGRGSVIASGVAALFLTQLVQLLLTFGASAALQLFAQALAIVIAVALRSAWPKISERFRAKSGALNAHIA